MKVLIRKPLSPFMAIALGLSIALTSLTPSTAAIASPADKTSSQLHSTGFVTLETSRQLYVDYIQPAPGKPIVVLLNGLTYRVGVWDSFVKRLAGDGLGILRYDMFGQGQTLLKYAPIAKPINLQEQVNDLAYLIRALDLKQQQSQLHFVGLSYGGAVGMAFATVYPDSVASLVLMAPYTAALPTQDEIIKMQIRQTRVMNPLNPATDDELYDFFLRQMVYSTYPAMEPIVLENPFKLEATFRLVQGSRRFKASEIVNALPAGTVHLIQAGSDQYIPSNIMEEFWQQIPSDSRVSRLVIRGTEHKIPEAVPGYAADWVRLILNGDGRLNGRVFEGSPAHRNASDGSIVIENLGD